MYNKTNWPADQDPKVSAIYALNDIDVKAPAEVVWKLLVDARNWVSYFPPEDQVKILSGEPELAPGTKWSRQLLDIWGNKIEETTEIFELLGPGYAMTPVAPGKNRVIYLLGHLLVIHDSLFRTLELGDRIYSGYDELFLMPQHPANEYPPYQLLLDQWVSLNETLTHQLRQLSIDEWQTKHHYMSDADFILHTAKNKFCVFLCTTTHLYHHVGQLVLLNVN